MPALRRCPNLDSSPPSRELVTLREKTERLLAQSVRDYAAVADRFEVPHHEIRVVVHPIDWRPGRTLLRFIVPVVVGVDPSPALYERLAKYNNEVTFGKFYVKERTIFIEHNLLGESVERRGFRAALACVAHYAGRLDAPLLAEFGGKRWSEHD